MNTNNALAEIKNPVLCAVATRVLSQELAYLKAMCSSHLRSARNCLSYPLVYERKDVIAHLNFAKDFSQKAKEIQALLA